MVLQKEHPRRKGLYKLHTFIDLEFLLNGFVINSFIWNDHIDLCG